MSFSVLTYRASVVTNSASGADYNVISPNDLTALTFSPGNTVQNIAISLVQDTLIEGDEVFSVILSTTNSNVQISDGVTTVTILDDDGESECFVLGAVRLLLRSSNTHSTYYDCYSL